jgi:hypothetical protein
MTPYEQQKEKDREAGQGEARRRAPPGAGVLGGAERWPRKGLR